MKVTFKSGQAATYQLQDVSGGTLRRLSGYVTGTANTQYFLHIFDTNGGVPVNTTAPKRSEQVLGQDGFIFDYSYNDLEFTQGIVFALSSTEETYTAVVDGAKVDWEGEFDTQAKQGSTTVGNFSSAVAKLIVWATATGPKYLYEVDWAANNGGTTFLLWFTKDNPVNGDTADLVIASSATQTKFLRFGKGGVSLLAQSGTKGCTLCVSTTAPTLTAIGNTDTIRAKYSTAPL